MFEKIYEAFYTMTFEYYHGSIHHLVYTYVLVCARASAFACVRYRTGEKNYVPEYIYICRFVLLLHKKCILKYDLSLFKFVVCVFLFIF